MAYRVNGKKMTKKQWDKYWAAKGTNFNSFAKTNFYVNKPIEYVSPMSGKTVTCRNQRKEEMKKYNVREVAPEEYNKVLKDRGFYDRKHPE